MKFRAVFSIIISFVLLTAVFSSCSKDNNKIVDPYGESTSNDAQNNNSDSVPPSQSLHLDESWRNCYALTYDFFDSREGSSTITEFFDGTKYISADAQTGIVTYIVPADGYLTEYFLDTKELKGTVSVVGGSDINSIVTGFYALSVTDVRLPDYSNTNKTGITLIAGRNATEYIQTGVYGTDNQQGTAKIYVDDLYGFTSKLEFYNSSREMLLSWELKGINTDEDYVKKNMPVIDLTAYEITEGQA